MHTLCSTTPRSKGRDDGFTVAEFVAASAILLIVLVGVLGAVQFAGASTRMASSRQAAIDVATHQIEYARNLPWSKVGLDYGGGVKGSPPGNVPALQTITAPQGTFTVRTKITYDYNAVTHHRETKKMVVTVSWVDPAPGGSISVETKVFGTGGAANTGDIKVTCVDADDPSIEIPGIGVTLDPASGSNLFVPSEDDGAALFGDVPLGTASMTANHPDYLCDVSQFQAITVATGFQDVGFMPCQRASNAEITVVGGNGQPLQGITLTLVNTDPAHPSTATGVTGANGKFTFTRLWKSPSGKPYNITASYMGLTDSGTFLVSAGGQTVYQTLTIVAPSVITVFAKDGGTGNLITGKNVTIAVTDQSTGSQLSGSPSTVTSGSAVFTITHSGNYNVSVTGVSGYTDSPTNVVAATFGTGSNNVNVLLNPKTQLQITVQKSTGEDLANIPVTVLNPSGTPLESNDGNELTNTSGLETYSILTSGSHTIKALVNNIYYYSSPSPVTLLAGQPTPYSYTINITPGTLRVTTTGYASNKYRQLTVYNPYTKAVVYSASVRPVATTISGLVPGMYVVSVFGNGKTGPAYDTSSADRRDYSLTAPGVVSGSTYNISCAAPY